VSAPSPATTDRHGAPTNNDHPLDLLAERTTTATGETYDAVGNFPPQYFNAQWPALQNAIRAHLIKADHVPVDVSQFTAEQRSIVRAFVDGLGNPRVFIVGDH
jgi:CdiA C-terminal tRNase domain